MKTINIGIVGPGGMGQVHRANYSQITGCRVKAVTGTSNRSRDTALDWGVPCYPDIRSMVENTDIDIVDICTPTYLHHDMAIEALECGKDCICEKPAALNARDTKEMFETAQAKGHLLLIAQVLKFTKEVAILQDIVTKGTYGKPLDGFFERLSARPGWAGDGWLFDEQKSGLLLYDLHIHDLDTIVSVFGKPKGFKIISSCQREGSSFPEDIRICYDYGSFHVCGEGAWFNADIPFTARFRVYFEDGMLINDGKSLVAYQFGAKPRVFDTSDEVVISTGINVPPCGWYYNELKHFVDCVRRHEPSPRVTQEEILTVMEILDELQGDLHRWQD